MEPRVKEAMRECTAGSDEGRLTFPQVVGALVEAGVERYYADLLRSEKIYYLPNGESHAVAAHPLAATPAADFDAAAVEAAIRRIQAQRIDYRGFCEEIAAAGCVGYIVSLAGRRAVYFGRSADLFIERFPPSK